jgi:hypothetical protein
MQGILVATQPRGNLGEHADRRHVGGRLLQLFAQARLGLGNAVPGQCDGGGHQLRIAGGMAHVADVGRAGRRRLACRQQVVAERAPGLRQVGLQRHRAAQRPDGFRRAPAACQDQPKVEMDRRGVRLRPRQRHQDGERAGQVVQP